MSISTLFARGRQLNTNVHANSITLGSMTTTERNALTPEEACIVYDTTLDKLMLYANGLWNTISYLPPTGKFFALWTPTNSDNDIPNATTANPCNYPVTNNTTVRVAKGGAVVNSAGYVQVTIAGVYRVEGTVTVTSTSPGTGRFSAGDILLNVTNFNNTSLYGTTGAKGYATPNTVSNTTWTISISLAVNLAANGSIAFFVTNAATGAVLRVKGGGALDPLLSWFMIELISE